MSNNKDLPNIEGYKYSDDFKETFYSLSDDEKKELIILLEKIFEAKKNAEDILDFNNKLGFDVIKDFYSMNRNRIYMIKINEKKALSFELSNSEIKFDKYDDIAKLEKIGNS